MRAINILAVVVLIIGGLNWGLVALAEYDLVASIAGLEFGEANAFTRVIYGAVGISAVWVAAMIPSLMATGETDRPTIR